VFVLVELLTLTSLTLYYVWLLYMRYTSQMEKKNRKGDLMVMVVF